MALEKEYIACILHSDMLLLVKENGCHNEHLSVLALTVLVMTIDAQWEGMGDVGSARYEN